MSNTTANFLKGLGFEKALRAMTGFIEKHIDEAKATADVIKFFDELGDYTNGPSTQELKKKNRKKSKNLVSMPSDHMEKWEYFLDKLSKTENKCFYQKESQEYTLNGYMSTLKALMELWPDLRDSAGFEQLNLRRLNQDCLENWFGQLRNACGDNDHPTFH